MQNELRTRWPINTELGNYCSKKKNRATIERIATCKNPGIFKTELATNAPKALRHPRTN